VHKCGVEDPNLHTKNAHQGFVENKIILPLPGIKSRFICRAAYNLVTIPAL
jgi:hypothetical protein